MSKLDKLVKKAREHLDADEEVLAAVQGTYETKIMGNDTIREGSFIASNRRLVFYAKKLTGYDLESYPYANVSSIEMSKGMMGYSITFFASGNKVHMKWIDKRQDVAGFIETVRGGMEGGPAVPAAGGGEQDAAEQIRKLAQLRDEGILTDDEFQAKKAQLLGI